MQNSRLAVADWSNLQQTEVRIMKNTKYLECFPQNVSFSSLFTGYITVLLYKLFLPMQIETKTGKKDAVIILRLTPEQKERVHQAATENGRSVSEIIRELLTKKFK